MALQAVRTANPERGRTLLESTWKQDAAPERKEFIAILDVGLSDHDEAFLENALNDRSSDVRDHAASLLSKLPNSQFNARARERLRPILNVKKDKLGGLLRPITKTNNDKLEITLPDAFDPAWTKDGIEEKAPQGTGQKQHWVRQMLERANLNMLEELTGLTAIDLLKNTHKDWASFVRNAVISAVKQYPERELVKQLIAYDFSLVRAINAFKVLEPSFIETLVTQRGFTESNTDMSLLHACEHTWSKPFWINVLEWIATQCSHIQHGEIKLTYMMFAEVIIRSTPFELIPYVINGSDEIPYWTTMLTQRHNPPNVTSPNNNQQHNWYWDQTKQQFQTVLSTLQLRLEMHQLANTVVKETP